EFARAVVSLLRDPNRRRALGTAGRRLVEERFSWSHVGREFEARCTDIVDAARREGGPQRRSVHSCA
ncbi:MAG TPA: glycosyltransferase, partial [bacterium]